MRKVTNKAVQKFLAFEPFKLANTKVEIDSFNGDALLKLHNHLIARLTPNGDLFITSAGWNTNTTKERLNAIPNVSIVQKNYRWFLNGHEWDGQIIQLLKNWTLTEWGFKK